MENAMLTTREVASRLGTSVSFVDSQLKQGKLRGYRLGRVWRVSAADLEEYIAAALYRVPKPKYTHKKTVYRIG